MDEEFHFNGGKLIEMETQKAIMLQQDLGIDIFILMIKKLLRTILTTLDVPAVSIKNAICVGKVYGSKEELRQDAIKIMKEEIDNLLNIGVDVIQFDQQVLTEVVFTEGKPRSFMCAALSERNDPKEELEFASSLIGQILGHIEKLKTVASLHVCRGNWSKNESILLTGKYTPLLQLFASVNPDLLTLEFSTPRAGGPSSLLAVSRIREHAALGLGVINPRTDEIETLDPIILRVKEAMMYLPKEKIWLNSDCYLQLSPIVQ